MASTDPLEALVQRLADGDDEAAQCIFTTYEPYLRMVVRRQLTPALRAKFDSMDIVQSVWADLLTGFRSGRWCFETPEDLRVFLVKATRNRFIDRVRQQQTPLLREERMGMPFLRSLPEPRPGAAGEGLEAEEMWQRLLALCPEQHRGLLELKRQGLSLTEIATRTGLHYSSVRRILYDLSTRLAGGAAGVGPDK